jgi:phosphoribosyl-AMP cyclohydrolase
LKPDFVKGNGLLPAIVQEYGTGQVLMLAYVNEEAWDRTLETGEAHFFSRSRNTIWHKGGTSGHVQKIKEIRVDCDLDTILYRVDQVGGAACHKGYKSCFFTRVNGQSMEVCEDMVFDPKEVYNK